MRELISGLESGNVPYFKAAHHYAEILASALKGKEHAAVRTLAEEFYNPERLYPYSRSLISLLKQKGYRIIIVSNSLIEVLEPLKKNLHADAVEGIILDQAKGVYTGRLVSEMHLENGKNIVIRKLGHDMKDSIGFGDSEHDIGFLSVVEHPVVINARKGLASHAMQMGWTIASPEDIIEKVRALV